MNAPFKISWELVTPAIAREMLSHNPPAQNRKIRDTTVSSFVADMLNGDWSPTHQGIAFAVDGRLLDGQHRLTAIVESGIAIPFLVCRGMPEKIDGVKAKVMDTLDRGNARSIADVLKIRHGQSARPAVVSAICGLIPKIAYYAETQRVGSPAYRKPTLHQILGVVELYRPDLQWVIKGCSTIQYLRSPSVLSAFVLAHAVEREKVERFYEGYVSGIGIKENSPILALRNYCLGDRFANSTGLTQRIERAMRAFQQLECYALKQKAHTHQGQVGIGSVKFFLDKQPKHIAALQKIFPKVPAKFQASAPVITAANWKPNANVEALLRQKEMSERLHGNNQSRIDKMRERVKRGELRG